MAAAIALFALLFSRLASEAAFAILGGYLIFFLGFHVRTTALSRWTGKTDISYGVYLYAWPIQSSLIYLYPAASPWLTGFITLVLSALCGFASWICIEQPALAMKRYFR
jgi:peptidoglycan/LPS O-acetylase OafA/YrhL